MRYRLVRLGIVIPIEYELGKRIVETCTCGCGAALTLPWGGSWGINSHVIKCPVDWSHDTVVPTKSFYKMWKDGEELPSFIKDSIERRERSKIMEQNNVKVMVVKQDADKLGTYLQAKFPQDLARRDAAMDFARWCIAHQLEPVRDCIPYHGNPYITVEWLDRKASGDKEFQGYTYKVFSQKDKEALDFDPKDLVVECQAKWDGLDKPLIGLGVVTKIEREAKTGGELDELTAKGYRAPVIRLHPQSMLFKRARAATLKQHYHIPAPILEELPYTVAVEAEYTIKEAPKRGGELAPKSTEDDEKNGEPPAAEKGRKGKGDETSLSSSKVAANSKKIGVPATEPEAQIEGEGFSIKLAWLKESLKEIHWSEASAVSWLSRFKVDPHGELSDVLSRLTREQAEEFVKEIQGRVEKHQPGLFD